MVHVNTKYINEDGTLNPGYATNKDGLAVLGFLYKKARNANVILNGCIILDQFHAIIPYWYQVTIPNYYFFVLGT